MRRELTKVILHTQPIDQTHARHWLVIWRGDEVREYKDASWRFVWRVTRCLTEMCKRGEMVTTPAISGYTVERPLLETRPVEQGVLW